MMKQIVAVAAVLSVFASVAFAQRGQLTPALQQAAAHGLQSPRNSQKQVKVTWTNNSDGDVKFQWVGFDGKVSPLATIAKGKSFTGDTTAGHIFVFHLMNDANTAWASYPLMVPGRYGEQDVSIYFDTRVARMTGVLPTFGDESAGGFKEYNTANGAVKLRFDTVCDLYQGGGFGTARDHLPGGPWRVWNFTRINNQNGQTISTAHLTEMSRNRDTIILQDPINLIQYRLEKDKAEQMLYANGIKQQIAP